MQPLLGAQPSPPSRPWLFQYKCCIPSFPPKWRQQPRPVFPQTSFCYMEARGSQDGISWTMNCSSYNTLWYGATEYLKRGRNAMRPRQLIWVWADDYGLQQRLLVAHYQWPIHGTEAPSKCESGTFTKLVLLGLGRKRRLDHFKTPIYTVHVDAHVSLL